MNNDLEFLNIDLNEDNSPDTVNKPTDDEPSVSHTSEPEQPSRALVKRSVKRTVIKEILSYIVVIAAAFALAFITNHCLIVNARIPTGSMISTIMPEDRIIGNRLAYINSNPERGDIIVFYYPDDESEKFVKRVIGLPGEVVEIKDGKVYINGSTTPLDEPYVNGTPSGDFGPYNVPADCYFVLGDNRNNSKDSRYWINTYVHKKKIIAKALFCYYPSIHTIN